MAQDRKDERFTTSAKKADESGDETGKRTSATAARPAATTESRPSGNGGSVPATPGRRREQYLIGTRNLTIQPSFGPVQPAMDAAAGALQGDLVRRDGDVHRSPAAIE